MRKSAVFYPVIVAACLGLAFAMGGCSGSDGAPGQKGDPGAKGDPGDPGAPGVTTAALQGTVTNSLTGNGVAGATISLDPAVADTSIVTADDGSYSAQLPFGVYAVTVEAPNYTTQTNSVSLIAGGAATKDVVLEPVAPVVITTKVDGSPIPGNKLTASATVAVMDGSQLNSVTWSQKSGAAADLTPAGNNAVDVVLPEVTAFKDHFFDIVANERHALLDRNTVVGVTPFDYDEASAVALEVTVVTSKGTYTSDAEVAAELPFNWQGGIRRIPIGVAILLHGKSKADGSSYQWTVTPPAASAITGLMDADTQNPYFTPDVAGKYVVSESEIGASLELYAGSWVGALDSQGQPNTVCTACHDGDLAPDKFTPWIKSGHAEIFKQNLNDGGHYSSACFSCHTVGYNLAVSNNGVDDQPDYPAFLDHFFPGGHSPMTNPNNWNTVLTDYPTVAHLANVQCENCHGPIDGAEHRNVMPLAGRSVSSDVCGVCHGEPTRHGRFQQWQESLHADYTLAEEEATVENRGATAAHCGRCHAAQGFLAWIDQGDLTKQIQGASGNATVAELTALGLTVDTVHPQTCVVCHDPHAQGTTSGEPNTATVRISGDTPMLPAGFAATGVGRGAICITCHNTRNGAHNDQVGLPSNYSAPHTPAQGDVLMGQNAYFVTIGDRSPHSFIEDTCATCHMELTPPPPEFSLSGAGTNHSFTASITICGQCHGVFDGGTLQATVEGELEDLGASMGGYLQARIDGAGTIVLSDYTPHDYNGAAYDLKSAAVTVEASNITSLSPTEPHGQQGYIVNFATPVDFTYSPAGETPHTVSLMQAQVQLGDFAMADGTTKIIAAGDPLVRAGWNYFLIHGDASKGIHNPSFTQAVLNASQAALQSTP